ncbi:aldo/keto reductase [Deminuibacter soli]|nr:aldo/keto reductase [Deminuibacter soli]
MKYKQLGNSGLVVSELTLGTMTFGEGDFYGLKFSFDQKGATELIATAIDKGINFFDTADGYGNGQSEEILGKALAGKRKDVLIASKACFRTGPQVFNAGVNAKHLIEQCENSLKKLQTDYLDVFLLHNEDPITPVDESLKAVENLVQRGLIRYAGFSNYQAWKAATMIQRQKDLHYSPFITSQMHYSILNREVESEFVPMSLHHGVGMMVWSPLSSGFLTGKYTRSNPQPEDGRLNSFDLGLFDRELGYTVVDAITEIGKAHNTTPTAVAIAWLLSKKVVSTVIVGISKMQQLESNLQGAELELSTAEIAAIDALTQPVVRYPATFAGLQDQELVKARNNSV